MLLHGFPTSSILAPDYPGFGFSAFPPKDEFEYTFKNISSLINKFTEKIGLSSFSIYLHDYGCPIGLRLCVSRPEKIEKIIVQNGNAYEEGLGSQWDETRDYWKNPTEEKNIRFPKRRRREHAIHGHILEDGHMALETNFDEVVELIIKFLE